MLRDVTAPLEEREMRCGAAGPFADPFTDCTVSIAKNGGLWTFLKLQSEKYRRSCTFSGTMDSWEKSIEIKMSSDLRLCEKRKRCGCAVCLESGAMDESGVHNPPKTCTERRDARPRGRSSTTRQTATRLTAMPATTMPTPARPTPAKPRRSRLRPRKRAQRGAVRARPPKA